jgi:hypothetical protein
MQQVRLGTLAVILSAAAVLACGDESLMGFSAVPPRNDTALVVPAINLWAQRAREAGPHQLGCRV